MSTNLNKTKFRLYKNLYYDDVMNIVEEIRIL